MSKSEKNLIPKADAHTISADALPVSMSRMVEVTHVHVYHAPDAPSDINGFTFVLRDGEARYTIALREGVQDEGVEPMPATVIETGSPTYVDLMDARAETLGELTERMADIGPLLADLVADLKS